MLKLITCLLIAITSGGCAETSGSDARGNFVNGSVAADEKTMALDAARKLAALYPPAKTRFSLRQEVPDVFGIALVASLRSKGYAMAEIKQSARPSTSTGVTVGTQGQVPELSLAYLIDQPLESGLYRVSLRVDSKSLSRLYQAKNGSLAPICDWIRKE